MSVFDGFKNNFIYKGDVPEAPSVHNVERMIVEHGEEWVAGYLKAMEIAAVELADILQPRQNNPCGFSQSPHMVRTNLKKYWDHNKQLYLTLLPHILPVEPSKNKPEL